MTLPRGRFTDALVAFGVFIALLLLFPIGFSALAAPFAVAPAEYYAGLWQAMPVEAALAPLAAQFLQPSLIGAAFAAVFLLIAGRFVERVVGGPGLIALFVAGSYGGMVARLVLTPGSIRPGVAAQGGLFALVGAYCMLYGVPRVLPVAQNLGRMQQVTALAAFWIVIELVFMAIGGGFDISRGIIEPLGGLLAGLALARPLLAWRYRKA